eukprot:472424-Karenia_brevis.AAC.1
MSYVALWLREPRRREAIGKTWAQLKMVIFGAGANRWKRLRGPIAATIATLLDIGWQPEAEDLWADGEGCQWRLSDNP